MLPLHARVSVCASNSDGLFALEKPSSVLSHPNTSKDADRAILTAPYDFTEECFVWTDEKGKTQRVWLINRLDSGTSGILLCSADPEVAQIVKAAFASHHVAKTYYAVVQGQPKPESGNWSDRLQKNVYGANKRRQKSVTIVAKTRYQLVRKKPGGFPVSLIRLMPVTGRTHQLRIQCAKHGVPIVGDRTYGNFAFNKEVKELSGVRRMLLHSSETVVNYIYRGKPKRFAAKSPLPDAFEELLRFRPGLNIERQIDRAQSVTETRRFRTGPNR